MHLMSNLGKKEVRIRKIKKSVPWLQIRRDLEKYGRRAEKLAVTDAKILQTDEASLDSLAEHVPFGRWQGLF